MQRTPIVNAVANAASLRPKTWGNKVGPCNICGSVGPLTDDHVPPRGAIRVGQLDLFNMIQLLSQTPAKRDKGRHVQGGVKFRTLCGRCNNTLLGTNYDPVLLEFGNAIAQYLQGAATLSLPDIVTVATQPGLLARAVLGHLFAVGVARQALSPAEQEAAAFVVDPYMTLPDAVDIFYWVYPQRQQVQVRDCMLFTNFSGTDPIRFWCLKYFPIAFMVTWHLKHRERIAAPNLRDYILGSGVHPANVILPLRSIPHPLWPEAPIDNSMVVYGADAVGAVAHSSSRKP